MTPEMTESVVAQNCITHTHFNLEKWNQFACACRCIVEIQRRRDVELRPEDIYEQFIKTYPFWAEKPGATDNLARCRIIDYYRIADAIVTTTDPERVLMLSKEPEYVATLGMTERLWNTNAPGLSRIEHVVLVTPKEELMSLWYPRSDGTHQDLEVGWYTWYHWMMHAMVLMK